MKEKDLLSIIEDTQEVLKNVQGCPHCKKCRELAEMSLEVSKERLEYLGYEEKEKTK